MARCKFCGAEPLKWEYCENQKRYDLFEPEGEYHDCKHEDRRKEFERVNKEKAKICEATRRWRETNGYL